MSVNSQEIFGTGKRSFKGKISCNNCKCTLDIICLHAVNIIKLTEMEELSEDLELFLQLITSRSFDVVLQEHQLDDEGSSCSANSLNHSDRR